MESLMEPNSEQIFAKNHPERLSDAQQREKLAAEERKRVCPRSKQTKKAIEHRTKKQGKKFDLLNILSFHKGLLQLNL